MCRTAARSQALGLVLLWALAAPFSSIAGTFQPTVRLAQAGPTITSLSPNEGPLGTLITIRGTNFAAHGNQLEFRGEQTSFRAGSAVDSADSTSLEVHVSPCPAREPQCPTYYVPPGVYAVTVINAKGVSNEASFSLTRR